MPGIGSGILSQVLLTVDYPRNLMLPDVDGQP